MPIRKTKKGWKWGSKGPFKTKKKAQQVARAAYASGYLGEGMIKRSYLEQIIREEYELYMEESSRRDQEKIAKKEKEETAKDAVKEIPAQKSFSPSPITCRSGQDNSQLRRWRYYSRPRSRRQKRERIGKTCHG